MIQEIFTRSLDVIEKNLALREEMKRMREANTKALVDDAIESFTRAVKVRSGFFSDLLSNYTMKLADAIFFVIFRKPIKIRLSKLLIEPCKRSSQI